MKSAATPFRLILLVVIAAGSVRSQDTWKGEDTIFLQNGEKLAGKITGFDGLNIRLQRILPPLPGALADSAPVIASVTLPCSRVRQIEFSSDEVRDEKLRHATTAEISEIGAFWRESLPWLAIPRSPTGEIGLAFADLLLRAGDLASARKAFDIFKIIEAEAWSRNVVTRATQGRLRAMVATGSAQEAITEARRIAQTAEDPTVLIEAKFILAQAADKALREFVADNPRWKEDPFALPERDRLYNEALALFLYPALFFGSESNAATRGLWGAVEVYRFAGDLKQAVEASRDLVSIYPGTDYAKEAQAFMATLPDSFKSQDNEPQIKQ
jgi:hypothetical protein